jgi:putative ABC transport system permease protein
MISSPVTALKTAAASLRAHKGRTLLTILGIVIGIVAIVLVIALGQGAKQLILSEVQSIGANTIIIRPGRQPDSPAQIADTLFSDSLTVADVNALREPFNVPGVISVHPAVLVSGEVTYQNQFYRPTILGWTASGMSESFQIEPQSGTVFSNDQIRQRAKVAIIGSKVKTELFGESDALGHFFNLRGQRLQIIGIYPPRGQVLAFNLDDIVLLPYTTAQKDILGINHFHEVFLRFDPLTDPELVADNIRATLRERHGITDPAKDDFFVMTQQDIADRLNTITSVLTIFLVAIASISLLVGGIGIMNIMLVSVTERTHEIGLRKAVGATSRHILRQFLLEAAILTSLGGILGTILALALSYLITFVARSQYQLNWPWHLPYFAILLGLGVSALIGLTFGIYPASQAAKKDPIEALRYE